MQLAGPIISVDEARELDKAQREAHRKLYASGHKPHKAKVPAFRMPGPLNNILIDPRYVSKHHHWVSGAITTNLTLLLLLPLSLTLVELDRYKRSMPGPCPGTRCMAIWPLFAQGCKFRWVGL